MPRRRDLPCSRCGKLLWRGRTSAAVPVCRECRREAAHGTPNGYNRHGCRCAECTEANRVQALAYRERRRAEGRPVKSGRVDLRECEHCGVEFESRQGRRFCSIECVGASRRRGGPRRERKSAKRRAAERLAAKAAAGTTGGRRVWVQGACLVCGDQFPPVPGAGFEVLLERVPHRCADERTVDRLRGSCGDLPPGRVVLPDLR